jgi:hypothetical protein
MARSIQNWGLANLFRCTGLHDFFQTEFAIARRQASFKVDENFDFWTATAALFSPPGTPKPYVKRESVFNRFGRQ